MHKIGKWASHYQSKPYFGILRFNKHTISLKNEIQSELKPKIEIKFKRIKEEMEVQKGLEIIEKLDPPTKKTKLGQE